MIFGLSYLPPQWDFSILARRHLDIEWRPRFNSLRPRRNGRYNVDDIFKCIFLKENVWIPTKISLKFVPKGPINNIPALVQIIAWRPPGDKPLSGPMMVKLPTHICVTRPQWVKCVCILDSPIVAVIRCTLDISVIFLRITHERQPLAPP